LTNQNAAAELRDARVLVVDDNYANRRILQAMLIYWHMRPHLIEEGPSALLALQNAAESGEPFDLVLLDAMMPGMDGFTVAEHIRSHPLLADTPIILLTSADVRQCSARCKELGIPVHLMKPVKQVDLYDAIVRTLLKAKAAAHALWPLQGDKHGKPCRVLIQPISAGSRQLRILLAEDNATNQLLVASLLQKRGHVVVTAANGREAVDAYSAHEFDLIVMDVQMPEMNGLEATAAIRELEKERGSRTPIVALTAHTLDGDRDRCLTAGMDAYVSKPIRVDDFMSVIHRLIPEEIPVQPDCRGTEAPSQWFDTQDLMARFEGDLELLHQAYDLFRQTCPRQLRQLKEAVERGDAAVIERMGHTIKGSVGNFGGTAAMEAALKLEIIGREQDLGRAPAAVERLECEIERLMPALTALV
jgi:CheY-like chemotaxis protein